MIIGHRWTAALLALLSAVALAFLPVGPAPQVAVQVAALLAATLLVALVAARADRAVPLPIPRTGPPPAAQQRRRGDFLRQSNPDTPGRPRPRAPGAAPA